MKSVRSVVVALVVVAGVVATGGTLFALGAAASAATVPSCVSNQLTVTKGVSQGAAGTIYTPLVITNHGRACAVWGVPAIQPVVGPAHRALGPGARNNSVGQMPVRHVVATGRSVSVAFGVSETGNYTPSSCVARSADGVIVSLGSFLQPRFVHMAISVCTKRASTFTRLIVAGVNGY